MGTREELTMEEIDEQLNTIYFDMIQRAAWAREKAKKAWKARNIKKHEKYCAVARVWKICSDKVRDVSTLPF